MIPTLITESFRYCYGNDHGITPHLVHPSRAPASRAFWNGLEWRRSFELKSIDHRELGLWLLVVETLILNIISQRAREMMTMTDWTPEELAAEAERRAAYEATGMCPDSGYTIEICWAVELCDCAYGAPDRCPQCGVAVWDLGEHERRQHP